MTLPHILSPRLRGLSLKWCAAALAARWLRPVATDPLEARLDRLIRHHADLRRAV